MDTIVKMFCVRCRKHCENPTDVKQITNRRNVEMLQAKCSNIRADGQTCGSVVNTFVKKKKEVSTEEPVQTVTD